MTSICKTILYIAFLTLTLTFASSCDNSSECGNAPKPLSLKFEWVDSVGTDLSFASKGRDTVMAMVITPFDTLKQKLKARAYKDSTLFYYDAMPGVRLAIKNNTDTVLLQLSNKDIDTLEVKIEKVKDECFSSIYRFVKLNYNHKALSGTDSLYIVNK